MMSGIHNRIKAEIKALGDGIQRSSEREAEQLQRVRRLMGDGEFPKYEERPWTPEEIKTWRKIANTVGGVGDVSKTVIHRATDVVALAPQALGTTTSVLGNGIQMLGGDGQGLRTVGSMAHGAGDLVKKVGHGAGNAVSFSTGALKWLLTPPEDPKEKQIKRHLTRINELMQ